MTGATVTLTVKTANGKDSFGNAKFTTTTVDVANVLIGQPSTDDVTSSMELYGKKIEYMLGIPKGDTNNWEDTTVTFFGQTFRTFGHTIEGIEANVPTPWHKKVRVERF